MTKVSNSLNRFIPILAVITLIGILFFPTVSAGKFLNYGPIHGTIKTIPAVKYVPAPSSFVSYPQKPSPTLISLVLFVPR